MRPAFSVVFLTTLIGAGQGLFLAIFAMDALTAGVETSEFARRFFTFGAAASVALCALGLLASFFHLGRPERAWRSAAMWRTSWLSREVIALPTFMALTALYGIAHARGWANTPTLAIGAVAGVACAALFYCTSMIYACVKFLQEWASRFTPVNFVLMGCASGILLAAALAAVVGGSGMVAVVLAKAALAFTLAALVVRLASLARNARIHHKSTIQSATGLHHPKVRQISQGFTGASFNTQEFFHGASPGTMRAIAVGFILLAFVLPAILLAMAIYTRSSGALIAALPIQYAGLVLERWYFLADSRHPQNLYYQNVA